MWCFFCHKPLSNDTMFMIVSVSEEELCMCEECRKELIAKITMAIDARERSVKWDIRTSIKRFSNILNGREGV